MASVIMIVQYEVNETKLDKFQLLIQEMKNHYQNSEIIKYTVFNQKGKPTSFTEVYSANSVDDFDKFIDSEDDATDLIAKQIVDCVVGTQRYQTLVEA